MSRIHQHDSVSSRTSASRWLTAVILLGLPAAAGCGDPTAIRTGDIRRYTAAKETAAAGPRPERERAGQLAIRYEPPAGWVDRGASGMRLATLLIGPPAAGHEVTVIPASGSLEANVARWLGQLDPAAPPDALAERAAAALADAERLELEGGRATVVALYDRAEAASGTEATGATEDAGEAILAGVIPIDETASLFVKFKGPAAIARRERENFSRFVSSIRWK
jgi:hypothetical protein